MLYTAENIFIKSVLDPIHGLIKMTEEEMEIISHPLFNRLRRIKQNTFLYYVFPSANHTRFEHSIGVMHLASEMFLSAIRNGDIVKNKQRKYNIKEDSNIVDSKYLQESEFVNAYLNLRIAALLHDIGHGPMSHLFDKFAPKSNDFLEMVKNDQSIKFCNEFAAALDKIIKNSNNDQVEHEYVSYYFTVKILLDLGFSEERIKTILTIMNENLNLKQININGHSLTPFLNQIVAGAPLDCDRMDYLLRDSYFTGVRYGKYDLNRLLKSLLGYIDNETNKIRLGIKNSGLPAIENFLQARYELYIQVYFHKTNQSCNTMLLASTATLINNQHKFVNCNSVKEFIEAYLKLSDEKFLDDLENAITNEIEKSILTDLRNRRLWKRLVEIFPEEEKMRKSDIENRLKGITGYLDNKYPDLMPWVKPNFISNDPLKDLNGEKAVLLKKDNDENHIIAKRDDWIQDSIIFKALSQNYLVGRIYIKVRNDEDSRNNFRRIKSELKELLKQNF
ncbi:hypothetical protein BC6307_21100 [Sutcliffiella cohnii]|uniref:HD/PDEase domain-containing protein n=1 Tax=Sutcliffiella cohnii TaxID=33932 RepID=A0A223KVU9_9BACI|nr:HD domain-containing protein [Sutcliffiella cohnii]AST93586.1 hypothetical protein BC6307_21100 [Sutcliffiella cohnii]